MRRAVLLGLIISISVACASLGVWQLRRLGERRASNVAATTGLVQPPIQPDSGPSPALLPYRRATVSGVLDEAREFVLRNRLIRGVPAVQIVTPLRLPGSDTALLINRGYVPAPDAVSPAVTAAEWAEPGRQTYHGTLLPLPNRGDGAPVMRSGRETWKGLDLAAMRARLPYPIVALYLIAEADSTQETAHTLDGLVYPFRAELPPMDEGPHLSYAIQWFGIGIAVLAFGVMFVLKDAPGKSRRPHPSPIDRAP